MVGGMTGSTFTTDPRGLCSRGLSAATGFHEETLKRWARLGRIPGRNYGGCVGWRFRLERVSEALGRRFGNAAEKEAR